MKIEKVEMLVANLYDKNVILIRNIKQSLYYGLVLKKVQWVIKFNPNAWLQPYIDMKIYLRKKAKIILKSWWIMQVFEKRSKMWENVEALRLGQQTEEENIWCQNQILILQCFSHNICYR